MPDTCWGLVRRPGAACTQRGYSASPGAKSPARARGRDRLPTMLADKTGARGLPLLGALYVLRRHVADLAHVLAPMMSIFGAMAPLAGIRTEAAPRAGRPRQIDRAAHLAGK